MQSDVYMVDSHKLHLHPERVAAWMRGERIAPIYVEVSPAGTCNQRCIFCALDFMGYKPRFLELSGVKRFLSSLAWHGTKSVMFGGEGEPLLHRDIVGIAEYCVGLGLDCAITTNGTLLDAELAAKLLPLCKWVKVSVNAGNAESYAKIHGVKPEMFGQVIRNLETVSAIKAENRLACALGMQAVWLPREKQDLATLVKIGRDVGLDYFVLKPYSQHPRSENRVDTQSDNGCLTSLARRLEQYNTRSHQVIVREAAFRRVNSSRSYRTCRALPFWGYVSADGTYWGCSAHIGDERFRLGDIYSGEFHQMAEPPREFPADGCRENCRMDPCNQYLDDLMNPGGHVNFI